MKDLEDNAPQGDVFDYCLHVNRLLVAKRIRLIDVMFLKLTSVAKLHNAENDVRLKHMRSLWVIERESVRS